MPHVGAQLNVLALGHFLAVAVAASPAGVADVYAGLNQCLARTNTMDEREGYTARAACYEKAAKALENEAKKALAEAKKICRSKAVSPDICLSELDDFMHAGEAPERLVQGMVYSLGGNHVYIEMGSKYEAGIALTQSRIDMLRHLIRRSKAVGW